MSNEQTCYFLGGNNPLSKTCPECGCPLATNGETVWCSAGEELCGYEREFNKEEDRMIETKELSFMESGMKAGINDLHQLYDEGWLTLETLKLRLGRYYIKLYKETQGKKKTYEFKKGEIVKYGDVMPVVSMTENDWWKYEGHMIRILKDIKFTVTIEMEDK